MNWEVWTMRYKTSCFNPTLLRHNLRRFWPLAVVVLAVGLLCLTTNYHASVLNWTMEYSYSITGGESEITRLEHRLLSQRQAVYSSGILVVIIQFCTALLSSLLVMNHIHGRKQIQFYHGLPLSRRCIYITSVISGYLMALLPMVLAELCMIPVALWAGAELFPIFQLIGITLSAFTIFYAVAIVACTLAGQGLGAVCLYTGILFGAVAISLGAAGIARYLLPGFDEYLLLPDVTMWLTPLVQSIYGTDVVYDAQGRLPIGFTALPFIIYGIVGLVILVGGGFLYQHRKGETAGEMIAFPFLRGVCKTLVALIVGLGGTVVLVLSINPYEDMSLNLICLLVLGMLVLGWMAAEMVIRKTFRVFDKKALAQCGSLLVLTLVVLVGARLDVLGYVNHIPEPSEISSVYLSQYGDLVRLTPEDAIYLHELVLENRQELSNNTSYRSTDRLNLTYQDQEGETLMTRDYYVIGGLDSVINTEFLKLMDENADYNGQSWFYWKGGVLPEEAIRSLDLSSCCSYDESGIRHNVSLMDNGEAYPEGNKVFAGEDGKKIYRAILQDIQEGNLPSIFHRNFGIAQVEYGYIQIWANPGYDGADETGESYFYLDLTADMTNTLKALEELGTTVNPEFLEENAQRLVPTYEDVAIEVD